MRLKERNRKILRQDRLYRLLPVPCHIAQQTNVHRAVRFLSASEIAHVLNVVDTLELPAYTSNAYEDLNENNQAVHITQYLNTSHLFTQHFPWLKKRVRQLVHEVNALQRWGFDTRSPHFNIRVAEAHEMEMGGSLASTEHYDIGSLITVDIMLQEADEGALFQTFEANKTLTTHIFHPGDALVFVSHKYHNVSQLRQGRRRVLIVEYWAGEERPCGHRCDVHWGNCDFTPE